MGDEREGGEGGRKRGEAQRGKRDNKGTGRERGEEEMRGSEE